MTTMVEKFCRNCGKSILVRATEVERNPSRGSFCSSRCSTTGRFNPRYKDKLEVIHRVCRVCGKGFTLIPKVARQTKGIYCSRPCHWKARRTGRNPRLSNGYVRIYVPEHPCSASDGYVFEHRLVMEKMVGRHLGKEEVVHHVNHVRNDNRPENLMIMVKGEHSRLHAISNGRDWSLKLQHMKRLKNTGRERGGN